MIKAGLLCLVFSFFSFGPTVYDVEKQSTIRGIITDAEDGEPVAHAYIHLEELNRHTTSDRNGEFILRNLPTGRYNLIIHRLGYAGQSIRINVDEHPEIELFITLRPSPLIGDVLEVVADQEGRRGAYLEHASVKLSASALRRNLGSTLSETLSGQPGFEQRSMGPAPARPVIRGLGDERVLILQDGERLGDFSASSPDHSVSIDPINADEIEIARGPAALIYGSNAIGGVINVVRNQIPTSVPNSTTGSATLQSSTVNNGISLSGDVSIPMDDYVLNLELSGRYGNDYRSAIGRVDNSGYVTTNNAIGLSSIRSWGYSGLSLSNFTSHYGIPPDPSGGHPNGVDIEMNRFQIESRTELLLDRSFLKVLETQLTYRYYNHKEFETSEIIGTEFTRNSVNLNAKLSHGEAGLLTKGVFGIWGEFDDTFVFDRFNIESTGYSASIYSVQEFEIGRFHFDTGIRMDLNTVVPGQEKPNSRIGNIRQRTFLGIATSASAIFRLFDNTYLGATYIHSFRPPTPNELYSEGPHIAAYSFEIGNPDLEPERGIGKEIFIRIKGAEYSFELTGYRNQFSNYLYPRDTGRENLFFPRLNDFQFTGVEALIYGAEAKAEFQVTRNLVFQSSLSTTRGRRTVSELEKAELISNEQYSNLPMIPPLRFNAGMNYTVGSLSFGGDVQFVGNQNQTDIFEEPTDNYRVVNIRTEYRTNTNRNLLHTISLRGNNLLNERYFNHLSRVKEIFPEPGRNIQLLYRLYF